MRPSAHSTAPSALVGTTATSVLLRGILKPWSLRMSPQKFNKPVAKTYDASGSSHRKNVAMINIRQGTKPRNDIMNEGVIGLHCRDALCRLDLARRFYRQDRKGEENSGHQSASEMPTRTLKSISEVNLMPSRQTRQVFQTCRRYLAQATRKNTARRRIFVLLLSPRRARLAAPLLLFQPVL